MSGKEFARILADELGEPALFGDNVTVSEQLETQRITTEAEVQYEEEQDIAIEKGYKMPYKKGKVQKYSNSTKKTYGKKETNEKRSL